MLTAWGTRWSVTTSVVTIKSYQGLNGNNLRLLTGLGRKKEGNEPAKHNQGKPKLSIGGVGPKFKRMAELYKLFASGWDGLDFSDKSLIEMYNSESYGTPVDQRRNGYYVGKQWLNVNVAMWIEDRKKGHLVVSELYEDERFPHWWLDTIIK